MPARSGDATLNGERFGTFLKTAAPTEFDITERLKERNELVLELDFAVPLSATASSDSDGDELLFREVRLEIRG
jgi:hypothetical protein